MKPRLLSPLVALAALSGPPELHAAVSCSISAIDAFNTSYDALLATDTLGSGTFTVTCTRDASGDPTSVSFKAAADNGLNSKGTTNRAVLGASAVAYDLFTNASYTTGWTGKGKSVISGTVTLGTGVPSTQSAVMTYYSRIATGQTGLPQGLYGDTVTVSLSYGSNNTAATPVPLSVQISTVPTCVFSAPPGTVAFSYTAFSPVPATASTTFAALCSTTLPYTMALTDANGLPAGLQTSGVVAGLQYTLTLSASSGVGSGSAQFYTIQGTMPAGQAGTCSGGTCTDRNQHGLTISY